MRQPQAIYTSCHSCRSSRTHPVKTKLIILKIVFTYEFSALRTIAADVVAVHLRVCTLRIDLFALVEGAHLIEALSAREARRALLSQITDALNPTTRYVIPDLDLGALLTRSKYD